MATPEENYARGRTVDHSTLSKTEEAVYEWYLKSGRESRVKAREMSGMDEFSDVLSKEKINTDKKWVERMRQGSQQKDHTHRAEIAEYIIKTFANDSEWFGEDAAISETLEYDDRKNHTDFVVEWDNESGEEVDCELAIDCTVSEYDDVIKKKAGYIMKDIDRKKLTTIEYHDSNLTGDKSTLKMVPRVLLVVNKETLPELCKKLTVHTKDNDFYDQEKESHMQVYILKTIQEQLAAQLFYIESISIVGKEGAYDKILQKTQKVLDRVTKELEEKEKSLPENVLKQASSESTLSKQKVSTAVSGFKA